MGLPWSAWRKLSLPFSLFQDALLSLGSVIHIAGFQRAVKEALSAVLPKVVGALPHTFPTSQIFAQLLTVYLTQS